MAVLADREPPGSGSVTREPRSRSRSFAAARPSLAETQASVSLAAAIGLAGRGHCWRGLEYRSRTVVVIEATANIRLPNPPPYNVGMPILLEHFLEIMLQNPKFPEKVDLPTVETLKFLASSFSLVMPFSHEPTHTSLIIN